MHFAGSLAVVTVLAAAAHTAHAQPALTAPVEPAQRVKAKNPHKATSLSLLVPLVTMSAGVVLIANDNHRVATGGGALFIAGGIVGPAVGHWYGGNIGGVGMTVRAAATGAAILSFATLLGLSGEGCWDAPDCTDYERSQQRKEDLAVGVLVGSILTYFVSALYDISQADDVADSWNQRHALTFTPVILPASGGQAPGAALSVRF